jgi:hypothetical protein
LIYPFDRAKFSNRPFNSHHSRPSARTPVTDVYTIAIRCAAAAGNPSSAAATVRVPK